MNTRTLCMDIFTNTNRESGDLATHKSGLGVLTKNQASPSFSSEKICDNTKELTSYNDEVDSKYNCTFFPKENESNSEKMSKQDQTNGFEGLQSSKRELDQVYPGSSSVAPSLSIPSVCTEDMKENESSYNPFEIVSNPKVKMNKHRDFMNNKSKSDL